MNPATHWGDLHQLKPGLQLYGPTLPMSGHKRELNDRFAVIFCSGTEFAI